MADSVRFPKSLWMDDDWRALTAGAQLFAMACFMFRKNGAVTDSRIHRKTRWSMEFIRGARREIEASSFAYMLVGITKRRRLPKSLAESVKARDGYKCVACGADQELQIDHIHPVAHGGSDDMENLQTLCGPHNREKGARLDWVMA